MAIYYFRCTQFQSHRPFSACSPIIKGNPTNDFLKIKRKKPTASEISFNSKRQEKKENKRTQAHLEAEKYTTFYLSL